MLCAIAPKTQPVDTRIQTPRLFVLAPAVPCVADVVLHIACTSRPMHRASCPKRKPNLFSAALHAVDAMSGEPLHVQLGEVRKPRLLK